MIDEEVGQIEKAAEKARTLIRFHAAGSNGQLFGVDAVGAHRNAEAYIDDFFGSPGVEIISSAGVRPDRVFDRYFSKQPPFGTGKKKSEFPDAFAAEALLDFARAKQVDLTVVSSDGDWEAVCEICHEFSHASSLSEVVERVLQKEDHAGIVQAAAVVTASHDALARSLAEEIPNLGVYLSNVEGHVHSLSTSQVTVLRATIVGVEGDKVSLEVSFKCDVQFEVQYEDPSSWVYDSEDKTVMYLRSIEDTVS